VRVCDGGLRKRNRRNLAGAEIWSSCRFARQDDHIRSVAVALSHHWFAATSGGLPPSNSDAQADKAGRRRATPATTAKAWAAKSAAAKSMVEARSAEAAAEAWTSEAAAAATVKATATAVKATTAAAPAAPASQLSLVDYARAGLWRRGSVRGAS
jgi:hypothetical protein